MLNQLDFLIVLIFVFVPLAQLKRGFGKAVFDLAALLLAVYTSSTLLEPLAGAVKLAADPSINEAAVYATSFVVIGGVLMLVGKLLYERTLVSVDPFEPFFGGICGIAIAIILCHVGVRSLALGAGPDAVPPVIANSAMGTEFLTFETYHRLLEVLYSFDRS